MLPQPKNVIFTGGSGKAGTHIIARLAPLGHNILNLDLHPLPSASQTGDQPNITTLITDLTSSGSVFNALTSHFRLSEPFPPNPPPVPDAVFHFAGYSRNLIVPDEELFRTNVLGGYNVVEAACKLGVKKIVIASSITVYGVNFAQGDVDYDAFPVEEDVDVNPMDTYAMSKVCVERTSRGFARRFEKAGVDIYVLRIGRIIAPEEYEGAMFRSYVEEPEKWKGHGWSYMDVRDLAEICERCLDVDGLGYQVFNAVNNNITNLANRSTEEFLRRVCPRTSISRPLEKREAPISNRKIREMLGWGERWNWSDLYKG
jgi:nucleoside-diphosphate-sugar epimerase